jgi:hypothetical protein
MTPVRPSNVFSGSIRTIPLSTATSIRLGRNAEVVIIRDERDVVIQAGLRDEAIGKFCLEAVPQQIRRRMAARPQ